MDGPLVAWVMLPLVGSIIGLPRRQQEIAARIGAVVVLTLSDTTT